MKPEHDILFTPYTLGGVTLKNRYVMAPIGPSGLTDADGAFTETAIDYYERRARGGVGLIITGDCFIENDIQPCAMPSHVVVTMKPNCFLRTGKRITERVHAFGSKIFIQLSAGFGRVGHAITVVDGNVIAPSPVEHRWVKGLMCREMTVDEIHTFVKRFGESAAIAKRAGFDGCEIHAVHEGYLLDQFTLSIFNHRTDEYGGSLENRLRFAVEIVQEIKRTCGKDFPVSVRYSPKSFMRDMNEKAGGLPGQVFDEIGRDMDEGLVVAKMLQDAGYDLLDVDVGSYESWHWNHPPMYHKKGMYLPYAAMVRKAVDIPVMVAGRMDNPDTAADAVATGKADLIGLARPLLADPDYVEKVRRGRLGTIRPCLSCQEACMGRIQKFQNISCAVNPACARERAAELAEARVKKTIAIVGGGVAGCEAARVCALRGHTVFLFEKSGALGGNLIPGGVPSFKEDDRALVRWYDQELRTLGVHIKLNAEITAEALRESAYDAVILATGSKPILLDLGENEKVCTASDLLLGKTAPGKKIAVLGGGLVGCELALWLKQEHPEKEVTIVEGLSDVLLRGTPVCDANTDMLKALLPFHGVEIKTDTRIARIENGQAVLQGKNGEERMDVDNVALAVGYRSENALYEELRGLDTELHLLGDAGRVSNIMYAIWDAFEVARGI